MEPICPHCGRPVEDVPADVDLFGSGGDPAALGAGFCRRCGWPLGQAVLTCLPKLLELVGDTPATVAIGIANEGPGTLYYGIQSLPAGVTTALRRTLCGRLRPGLSAEIILRINPLEVGPGANLPLVVHTLTAGPNRKGSVRRIALEQCWERQSLAIPISKVTVGPLVADAECLLFGYGASEARLGLLNFGGVALDCHVECSNGYQVLCSIPDAYTRSGTVTIPKGNAADPTRPLPWTSVLMVRRDGPSPGDGVLRLEAPGLAPIEVVLHPVSTPVAETMPYAYTVGIDFGTSKTVVALMDCQAWPPTVETLTWPRLHRDGDPRLVPSAVFYDQHLVPRFGDEALVGLRDTDVGARIFQNGRITLPRGRLFVGMKTFMLGDAEHGKGEKSNEELSIYRVVVDYFEYLFTAIRNHSGGGVDLANALFVMSLPVLADDGDYQRQEELMRKAAAEALRRLNVVLTPEQAGNQLICECEPLCAAVDLLGGGGGAALPVADGEWVSVFDCGAGTTDVSLLQIRQGSRLTFGRTLHIGYAWGGDSIDRLLYEKFLDWWCDADCDGQIGEGPDCVSAAQMDGVDTTSWDKALWMDFMGRQDRFRFEGASRDVSRSELVGSVSLFKEQSMSILGLTAPVEATAAAAVATPADGEEDAVLPAEPLPEPELPSLDASAALAALGDDSRGFAAEWAPLDLDDVVHSISAEIPQARDTTDRPPLYAGFRSLCRDAEIGAPNLALLVGGTTLLRGWRQAVEGPDFGLKGLVMEAEPAERRFHVARGAARYPLLQVAHRLPEPLRIEILRYEYGGDVQPLRGYIGEGLDLPAGTPPAGPRGAGRFIEARPMISIANREHLLVRVLLGKHVVRQTLVAWHDGLANAKLLAPDLPPPASLGIIARASYLAQPNRIELLVCWNFRPQPRPAMPCPVEVSLPLD